MSRRVSLTEECVDILRLAWSGERFSYAGKRYQFDDVLVTPAPVQPGGPPLWTGHHQPAERRPGRALRHPRAAAGRARAWCSTGGGTSPGRPGLDPDGHRVGIIRGVLVTDDPERDWPPLREAERYRMRVYGRFAEEAGQGGKRCS